MRVALVCIAKNEDNYIDEWVNYHHKLGFDHIFIYQNDWRLKKNYDKVTCFKFDGYLQQLPAYNHFINTQFYNWDWVAFFDVDEFLVLKKTNSIKDFLSNYSQVNAVGINWVHFGDNGLIEVNGEWSVLKRFTSRQINVHRAIKSIVRFSNGKLPKFNNNPHNINLEWVDTLGQINTGPSSLNPTDEVAQLNHYFCKTVEEFEKKSLRGRACSSNILDKVDFDINNLNDYEDLYALNFFLSK